MEKITLDHVAKFIPENKPIGILVSGGFDSATLWYAAKKICMERGQDCLPYTIAKLDGAEYHSKKVMEVTCHLLGIPVIKPTMVGTRTEDPAETTRSGIDDVIRIYKRYALTAETAYFEDLDLKKVKYHNPPTPRYRPTDFELQFVEQPYFYFTKDKTLLFAKDLGILNHIIPVTHSCTEQDMGRCTECYWCNERELAFEKAKLEDYGLT